jgi:hypothetical protein
LFLISRGIVFGGIAVAFSIIAFILSLREKLFIVSTFLIVNGIIMITGGANRFQYYKKF